MQDQRPRGSRPPVSRLFVVRASSSDECAVDMLEERGRLETSTERTDGWLDEDANVWFRIPMRPATRSTRP